MSPSGFWSCLEVKKVKHASDSCFNICLPFGELQFGNIKNYYRISSPKSISGKSESTTNDHYGIVHQLKWKFWWFDCLSYPKWKRELCKKLICVSVYNCNWLRLSVMKFSGIFLNLVSYELSWKSAGVKLKPKQWQIEI